MKTNPLLLNLPRIAAAAFVFILGIISFRKLSGHTDNLNYILSGLCFLIFLIIAFSKWRMFYVHFVWILFWSVSMHQLYQHYFYYKIDNDILREQNDELRDFIKVTAEGGNPNIATKTLKPDE